MLERAVEVLAAAPMIHLVGYRRAFPVASYLAYALEKMAVPCILHSGVGKLATAHALRPRDAVLAITFAPYSPETIAFAEARRGDGPPGRRDHRQPVEPAAAAGRDPAPRLRGRRRRLPRALRHLRAGASRSRLRSARGGTETMD